MEKLQAALDKARKSRTEHGDLPDIDRAPETSGAGPIRRGADRWAALAPLELEDESLVKRRVVTRTARQAATPFDILRTKALLQMRKNGWTRLAITSPMPRAGKTTMSCNLALALSRQGELRSMLFDFDLRDPTIGAFFDTVPEYGLGEAMTGAVPFEKQAMRYKDNLIVSMAQREEPDPTRILLANETAKKLDMVQAEYEPDIMIFDLPSLLVNDDSRAFLKNADCAIIVARADVTQYSQFQACKREVSEQTNLLGVVLNAYRYDKHAYRTA